MKIEVFSLNNVVYKEGDTVDKIYFIKAGEVEIN